MLKFISPFFVFFFFALSVLEAKALTLEESLPGFCSYDGAIQSAYSGAQNNQYVNLSNDAGKGITWAVQVAQTGNYSIQFRYANAGSQSATQAAVRVNGVVVVNSLPFSKTSTWSSWSNSPAFSVSLNAGNNTVRLETTVASEFANIDSLMISGSGISTGVCAGAGNPVSTNGGVVVQPQAPVLTAVPTPSSGVDLAQPFEGKFAVSSSGQATYSLPLLTPVGSGDFTPNVTLNYNSGQGNGPLGLGWSLSAAGSVSRCRQSESEDKNFLALTLGQDDRFCLNGSKLVVDDAYAYGSVGATYKTVIYDFSRITSIGGELGNPDYFKIEHKNGRIDYYGRSGVVLGSMAKLLYGTKAIKWMLTSSEDGAGNKIDYLYEKELDDSPSLSEIRYGYGGTSSASVRILFTWDSRDDLLKTNILGATFYQTSLLYNVEVLNNGKSLRKYNLRYDERDNNAENDNLSRLSSIEECVGSLCKPPLTFDWKLPVFTGFNSSSGIFNDKTEAWQDKYLTFENGDINGDGLLDIVMMFRASSETKLHYAIASRNANGKITYTNVPFVNNQDLTVDWNNKSMAPPLLKFTDYNQDGRKDLVVTETYGAMRTRIFLSEPQADGTWRINANPVSAGLPTGMGTSFLLADVNGDGLEDVVRFSGVVKVRLLQPNNQGYAAEQQISVVIPPEKISPFCDSYIKDVIQNIGDFNADGRMDFVFKVCTSGDPTRARYEQHIFTTHKSASGALETHYYAKASDNFSLTDSGSDVEWVGRESRVVDINGDGYADIINNELVRLNTGVGFSNRAYATGSSTNYLIGYADLNGDGFLDRIGSVGDSNIYVNNWDSNANNFSDSVQVMNLGFNTLYNKKVFRDFDGDGHTDIFVACDSASNCNVSQGLWLNVSNGSVENKIFRIYSSHERKISITYEPINWTRNYGYIKGYKSTGNYEYFYTGASNKLTRKVYASSLADLESSVRTPFLDARIDGQNLDSTLLPTYNITGGYYVVTKSFEQISGSNDEDLELIFESSGKTVDYYYENGRIQAGGRGFLGFEKFTQVEVGQLINVNQYRQDWPFIGRVSRQSQYNFNTGRLLNLKEINWGLAQCFNSGIAQPGCITAMDDDVRASGTSSLGALTPYVFNQVDTNYYANTSGTQGAISSVTTTDQKVDLKGNQTFSRVSVSDGSSLLHETRKTSSYSFPSSNYSTQMGRATQVQVEAQQFGSLGDDYTIRQSTFGYFSSGPETGLLEYEILEPNNTDYTVRSDYHYNSFGLRVYSETTADGQTRRSAEYEYDALGRYVDKTYEYFTNGTDPNTGVRRLVSEVVQRDKYGTPIETRNYVAVNKAVTSRVGTSTFGVPFFTSNSDGSFVNTAAGVGNDPEWLCPAGTKTWTKSLLSGGSASMQCMDISGRVVREAKIGSSSDEWIITDIRFTAEGQLLAKSEPIVFGDDSKYWTISYLDELNRPVYTVKPIREQDGQQGNVKYYYENGQNRVVNENGQERIEFKNVLGQLARVDDANGSSIYYLYDARGNLKAMTDPGGNITTIGYDLLDRKVSMSDPDKGSWVYRYNHFNDLICQQDATGQQSTLNVYDVRGRLVERKDRRNTGSNCSDAGMASSATPMSTTYWQFDTASNGMGQLAKTYVIAGGYTNPNYSQRYTYDSLGRLSIAETSLEGHLNQLTTQHEKTTYDQYGRVFQVFDAARATDSFEYNGVEYSYTATGYPYQIKDAVRYGGVQKAYFTYSGPDAHGNMGGTYGNGAVKIVSSYGDSGLLKQIITRNSLYGVNLQNSQYTWDLVGNLKTRKETGGGTWIENYLRSRNINESFYYDDLNRLTNWNSSGDFSAAESVTYDDFDNIRTKSGGSAYQYGNQCSSSLKAGPHAVCNIGGVNFQYDNNGNLTYDSSGRSIQYTAYDLPSSISKAGHTTRILYDSDRNRFKRVDTNSAGTTTTLYIGNVEKIYYPDGSVEWKRYIGNVAIVSQTFNGIGVQQASQDFYLHQDHLGSLSMITDASGRVVKDFYYDPWGASRTPNSAITQWIAAIPFLKVTGTLSSRGFTGHESLDEVGLIHMNGRIYDPKIARFVQADPTIQDPTRTQSLNRYSYVWNNPLNATDPSGFQTAWHGGDEPDPDEQNQLYWDSLAGEDCSASCRANLNSHRDDASNYRSDTAYNILLLLQGNISSESLGITLVGIGSIADEPQWGTSKAYVYRSPNSVQSILNSGAQKEFLLPTYNENAWGYHYYQTETWMCSLSMNGCSASLMYDELHYYAAIGQDSNVRAAEGRITKLAHIFTENNIVNSEYPGSLTLVNRTLPGHVFHDGYVIRQVFIRDNSVWIRSTGIGVNNRYYLNPVLSRINKVSGEFIFLKVDLDMRSSYYNKYIK